MVLQIKNLSFKYNTSIENSLTDINLDVMAGDFMLLCGKSGSGKTTLLKMLKKEIAANGATNGEINYFINKDSITPFDIGYVCQNPDDGAICDTVVSQLAFGLENMGLDSQLIMSKIADISYFFGIEKILSSDLSKLSGGQLQKVNLASVLTMKPKILLLDEPTSYLDPIAARELVDALVRLNTETGLTVIVADHHTEEFYSASNRIIILDKGLIVDEIKTSDVEKNIKKLIDYQTLFPVFVKLFIKSNCNSDKKCPINILQTIKFLQSIEITQKNITNAVGDCSPFVQISNLYFKYEKTKEDIFKNADLSIPKNMIFSFLGNNGCGKSTILKLIAGIVRPLIGTVKIDGKSNNKNVKISYLPQNPIFLFTEETIESDYRRYLQKTGVDKENINHVISSVAERFEIAHLMDKHPYDLSGGEIQKCAIGKIMLINPQILLLDEPTKGLDAFFKLNLINIIKKAKADGITVIIVSHDTEFVAECSDFVCMICNKRFLSPLPVRDFFCSNRYYTTTIRAVTENLLGSAFVFEDIIFGGEA